MEKAFQRQGTVKICGESGDVEGATVESWKECLPEIVQGYEKDDIWNMDETGLFWRALSDKGFGQKSKQCKGGKKNETTANHCIFCDSYWKEGKVTTDTDDSHRLCSCFSGAFV